VDDVPAFVTALGQTDEPDGWRADNVSGGVVIDVESDEIVAAGLCMPHSPRWHDGQLWVLESGEGRLGVVDLERGRVEEVARLPGFTRGLGFAGPYAFVGLSQVREHVFDGLPLTGKASTATAACGSSTPVPARSPRSYGSRTSCKSSSRSRCSPGFDPPSWSSRARSWSTRRSCLPDAALADVPDSVRSDSPA